MPTVLKANVVDQQDNTPQFLAAIGKNIGDVMVAAKNSANNRRLYAAQTAAEQLNSLKTIFDVYGQEGYSPAMVLENGFATPVLKGLLKNLDVASGLPNRPDSYYEDATNKMMLDAQSSVSTASQMNWVLHNQGKIGSEVPPPQPTQPTPPAGSQTSSKETESPPQPNGGGQGGKTGTRTGTETGTGASGSPAGSSGAGGIAYPQEYERTRPWETAGGNPPQAFPQPQTAPQTVLPGVTPTGASPTPQPESNRPPSPNYPFMPSTFGQQDAFAQNPPQQQAPYIPPEIVARMRAQDEAQQQYYTQNPPQPMPFTQDRPWEQAAQNFQYEFPRTQPWADAAQNFQPPAQAPVQAPVQAPSAAAAQPTAATPAQQNSSLPARELYAKTTYPPDFRQPSSIYEGITRPPNFRQDRTASFASNAAPPSGATKPSPTLTNPSDTGQVTYVKLAPMTQQEVEAARANWATKAQTLMQKDKNSGVQLDPWQRRAQMEKAGSGGNAGGGGGQKPAVPLSAKDVFVYATRPGSDPWDSGNTAIDLSTGESDPKALAFGKNGVAWVTAPGTSFQQLQGQSVAGFQFGYDPDMRYFVKSITSKPDVTLALMKAGYLIPLTTADDVVQYYKARGFALSPTDESNIRSRAEKAIGAAKGTLDVPLWEIPEPLIPDYWKSQSQAPLENQDAQYAEWAAGIRAKASGRIVDTMVMPDTGPRNNGLFPEIQDISSAPATQPPATQPAQTSTPAPTAPAKKTTVPKSVQDAAAAAAAKAATPPPAATVAGATAIASGEVPPSKPGEAAVATMTLRDVAKAETAIQGFFTGQDSRRAEEIKRLQVSKNANPPPVPQSQNIFQQAIDTLNKFIQSPQTELTALDKAKIDRAAIVANSWTNAVWNQLSPAERIDLVKKANTFFDNMSSTQAEMLYGHNAATTVNTESEILLNLVRAQLEGERLVVQNNIALAQNTLALQNSKQQFAGALIASREKLMGDIATLMSNPKVSQESIKVYSQMVQIVDASITRMLTGLTGDKTEPIPGLSETKPGGLIGLIGRLAGTLIYKAPELSTGGEQLPATQTGQTSEPNAAVKGLIDRYGK
jgi:hypothetical protein